MRVHQERQRDFGIIHAVLALSFAAERFSREKEDL